MKEQFINACSEDLAMYLLERGPKDLVELTTWAQKYLIAHKEQLGKSKATVQPRRADQKKTVQTRFVARTPEVAAVLPLSWFRT